MTLRKPASDVATQVTEPVTREELTEALRHLASTAARIPIHWTDRKAAIHALIDQRLTELEALDP
jgi:hypothetical protein